MSRPDTPEELAIRDVAERVDRLGAHPLLDEAVTLLERARGTVAAWIDEPGMGSTS